MHKKIQIVIISFKVKGIANMIDGNRGTDCASDNPSNSSNSNNNRCTCDNFC